MSQSLDSIPEMGDRRAQMRLMRDDRLGGLLAFNRDHGDIGRFGFLFGDVVLVNTPELIHEVLVTKARSFEKSPIMRAALYPLAADGLFTSEGELWRRQRKLMAPLFHPNVMQGFGRDMIACAERAVADWRDGGTVDVLHEMTRITMAVAGRTLFDVDTFNESDELGDALTTALHWAGEQSASPLLIAQARAAIGVRLVAEKLPEALAAPLRKLYRRLTVPILVPGERTRTLKDAVALLDRRVERMIAERRAGASDGRDRRDLLSLLLSARDDETGEAMPDRQVRDEVLTLFVAGHETTATSLSWAFVLLGQHPAIYAALRAEVEALGHAPTVEDLPRLPLALRIFKESLRLYAPVYLFGRVAIADVDVGPYRMPTGTVVLISPYALHHRPELWPDPERFDPDRFLPEAEAGRHKSAYLPFSAGPRTCIGNHFALMEGPLVLATILWRYDLRPASDRPTETDPQATLRPKGKVPFVVTARSR